MPDIRSTMDLSLALAIALTAAAALLIVHGTLSPPGASETSLPFTDKQLHALGFAALVLPLGWVRPGWALGLAAAALAGGGAIELIQPTVGRSGEWADFAADAVGCVLGLLPGQIRQVLGARH